jgi:hypothetical protein
VDTGYLDRLIAKGNPAVVSSAPQGEIEVLERVAAIAAGMFAVLDPAVPGGQSGNAAGGSAGAAETSNWKQKGRAEALR